MSVEAICLLRRDCSDKEVKRDDWWRMSAAAWERIESPLLPPNVTSSPRANRAAMEAILLVLRTGHAVECLQ
jgi:hypothetical protein